MNMRALDKKLLRDLGRLWAQLIAIALVMACGIATIILSVGSYRALKETQTIFYTQYRFADVFASAVRAPESLQTRIHTIPGVMRSEFRIVKPAILDITGMAEPAAGIAISLPDHGLPEVNRPYLRKGRLPETGRSNEIAVVESFANAHGFGPGDYISAIMNGKKLQLRIVGVVLSPEYIYAIGPGDLVPDPRRFAVFYMARSILAGMFDMEHAFNDVALVTQANIRKQDVMDAIDILLNPYGGTLAFERKDQISHAFLDNELTQLRGMSFVIPPIFLFVAAFLVNMILSRLIALEREQIGLLKALGYSQTAIASHFAKLVMVIGIVGLLIGAAAGAWLGRGLARIYSDFYSFPFLIFRESPDLYAISAAASIGAVLTGAARAIASILALPPAVAMRPPAPTRYRSLLAARSVFARLFSPTTTMALRHLIRWPLRTGMTAMGVSMSVALLILASFSSDSVNVMIDTLFFRAERQDATLTFAGDKAPRVLGDVANLPGVLRAEGFREVAVSMRKAYRSREVGLVGLPADSTLAQALDVNLEPVPIPSNGILVSGYLARLLDVQVGDLVDLTLLKLNHRVVRAPVSAIVESFVGLSAFMNLAALDHLVGDGNRLSGARILIDSADKQALFDTVKETPDLESIALLGASRDHFRKTIEENINVSMAVYIVFAIIITFGVIYNSARIQLAEYARELASLRVLGFSKGEVSAVLLTELAVVVAIAQPLGWLLGYWFCKILVRSFDSDLFRLPLVVTQATFAWSSLIVLLAAIVSSLIVRRRVDHLDLVRALKTRE